jgi:hypothetical protein
LSRAVDFITRITAVTTPSDKANVRGAALDCHELPTSGKLAITPARQMINQRDLSLVYSSGVAFAFAFAYEYEEIMRVRVARYATYRFRTGLEFLIGRDVGRAETGAAGPPH